MSEEQLVETNELSRWEGHKFMILVALTIVMSMLLVAVSLWLYNESGAAQLDLSRPGYESARSQAVTHTNFEGFSSSGPIDKEALESFRKLYEKQLEEATAAESFGGDVMSDEALGISAVAHQ